MIHACLYYVCTQARYVCISNLLELRVHLCLHVSHCSIALLRQPVTVVACFRSFATIVKQQTTMAEYYTWTGVMIVSAFKCKRPLSELATPTQSAHHA